MRFIAHFIFQNLLYYLKLMHHYLICLIDAYKNLKLNCQKLKYRCTFSNSVIVKQCIQYIFMYLPICVKDVWSKCFHLDQME